MQRHMKLRHPRPYPAPNTFAERSEDAERELSLTGNRNLKSLSDRFEVFEGQRLDLNHRPQRQNATSVKISENEDSEIIENRSRYKSNEGKELLSLIQRLEDEVKQKFDQQNDGLKKRRDNKIKNLGEIKQDIETFITCKTGIKIL